MHNVKVGDKIRITKNRGPFSHYFTPGGIYEVIELDTRVVGGQQGRIKARGYTEGYGEDHTQTLEARHYEAVESGKSTYATFKPVGTLVRIARPVPKDHQIKPGTVGITVEPVPCDDGLVYVKGVNEEGYVVHQFVNYHDLQLATDIRVGDLIQVAGKSSHNFRDRDVVLVTSTDPTMAYGYCEDGDRFADQTLTCATYHLVEHGHRSPYHYEDRIRMLSPQQVQHSENQNTTLIQTTKLLTNLSYDKN